MEQQYQMERRLLRSAFVLFLLTAVLVLLALFRVDARGLRITLLILSVLPFAVCLWLLFLIRVSHVAAREKRNFFLYDPRRRANRELSELSSEEILERGFRYMSMFRRGRQFYIASLFDEEGGAPEVFKPLFCYLLFQLLILDDAPERWDAFLACGKELADTFDRYLAEEGEDALCVRLQEAVACFPEEGSEGFRAYLLPLRAHFSDKIMSYVRRHIHEFE